MKVDEKYEALFFKEGLIKKSEKLPQKIKLSLETGKNLNKIWNDNDKLSSLINDCINIEKNIADINEINKMILKGKENKNLKIKFSPEEIQKHSILQQIKSFGTIFDNSYKYIFKKCPENIKEDKTFTVTGENENNNCLTCNKTSKYKYLVNIPDLGKNCVEECPKGTFVDKGKYQCIIKNENENEKNYSYVYIIIGVLGGLIIIAMIIFIYLKIKKRQTIKEDEALMAEMIIKNESAIE